MSFNNNIYKIISNKESAEKINFEKENDLECLSTKEKEITKISNNDSKKEPIYIMTLELEKGKPEKLKIYSDSDPLQIASDFCKEHNLDYNGLDYLRQKIETLLNENNIKINSKKNENNKAENINKIYNQYSKTNNNINNGKENNDNLGSPKQKGKNKNNININKKEKNYSYNFNNNNSSSKNRNHKCKARIQNNENSDKKFERIYQEIINKNNNNINNNIIRNKLNFNTEKLNKNNLKIKNYNEYIDERNKQIKIEKEKELFEIEKELNQKKNKRIYNNESRANSSIKNCRKKNYFNLSKISNNKNKYYSKKLDSKISKVFKEYEEKYSFHPSINENYKTDLTFEQRQTLFNNLYKKRKEELKNFYLNSKKDEFGNILFRPKLISKSKIKNNKEENKTAINTKNNEPNENDIFHRNYIYWKKYNLDKEELYNKYYNNKNEQIPYAKKQNEKIINETKIRAFSHLFKDLDGDQDNLINGINININKIPENIYKIIEPLLNELKEDNQSLNKDEFIIAMNKLFEDISSLERRIIINIYSKKIKKNKSFNVYNDYLNINNNNNIYYNKRTSTPNYYNNGNIKTIPCTNNNTNKLAIKHYKKISRMLDNIYKTNNNNLYNINLNKSKNEKIKENKYFGTETNKVDDNFTYICNCTFNNYIKKLN